MQYIVYCIYNVFVCLYGFVSKRSCVTIYVSRDLFLSTCLCILICIFHQVSMISVCGYVYNVLVMRSNAPYWTIYLCVQRYALVYVSTRVYVCVYSVSVFEQMSIRVHLSIKYTLRVSISYLCDQMSARFYCCYLQVHMWLSIYVSSCLLYSFIFVYQFVSMFFIQLQSCIFRVIGLSMRDVYMRVYLSTYRVSRCCTFLGAYM